MSQDYPETSNRPTGTIDTDDSRRSGPAQSSRSPANYIARSLCEAGAF